MPGRCFVPNCKSGYDSCTEKYSVFKAPIDMIDIWNKSIPRSDRKLSLKDVVCERHVTQDNIVREWVSADGLTKVPYRIPRLKKGAFPTIFPNKILKFAHH